MHIELIQTPDPSHRAAILAPLDAHNFVMTGQADQSINLGVLLCDADGAVEGGLWGSLWYGWFKLEYAFLPEHRRGNRLGARILSTLEAAAVARGAHGVWMQSFSFQAPGFYQKLGYQVVGVLDDRPPGHHDVFLAKTKGFALEGADLVVTENPTPEDRLAIRSRLVTWSNQYAGPADWRELTLVVRDAAGAVIGGLSARTGRGWLFVELLGLPPEARGTGMGSQLLRMAEDEARKRGCIGAYLDTFSFQARPFYEKHGYEVFGQIDDYPIGHARYFLSKRLDQA